MDLEMEFHFDKEKCAKALFFSFDPIDEQKSYEIYGHDEDKSNYPF
jgi:hypothetical protein